MPLASEEQARALVANKRVAVVCNAPEVLDSFYGEQIDGFDIVLRMNRAWPTPFNRRALGMRTDILTGGVIEPLQDLPFTPPWIWWFKHTRLGDQHLGTILGWPAFSRTKVWQAPEHWITQLTEEFGHGPSSGPAAIDCLQRLGAFAIEVFGLSCWGILEPGEKKHWWKHAAQYRHLEEQPLVHAAEREAAWLKRKLHRISRLHWEVIA